MTRRYREIVYSAPLSEPVEGQAWIAQAEGDWRLVVFPGTPSRKYLFERFLRLAPPDLEVVVLARPGYARGHARAYLDFDDQVAAARPFLDGGKKVVTLGVSYGGALAFKVALDFPEIVRGVVSVAALVAEPRPWVQPFVDLGGAPAVRGLLPRTLHHARAEVAGRRAQIGPLFARLKELAAPVTILHGDLDHLVAFSDAETLRGFFAPDADVELARVRGGTHFLEMQYPRRLYAAARSVIARAEDRRPPRRLEFDRTMII
ncbi:alpha/beta fold hydrolase [Amphiplicatus metriothermophilus]|uniref:Lysophospholipase, alpha-beta hydrolase superfamily n=1 Tax=Amphiplicatus metriothermophilus TaxID=1519374 RepID=A0A239PTI8_9PROT|nr:alpha/beta fold hydrolase [Amphiplicatus metriothermophilus]MBB5519429.1 pimeloyl-ACP methyl ester carboxylesterase [Amphiplicatus metriothermophilus]SNT73604.1 Lysophospholipase, alpha-beta hydrolase superfamily [Amphiplicatus metriothermophilus]